MVMDWLVVSVWATGEALAWRGTGVVELGVCFDESVLDYWGMVWPVDVSSWRSAFACLVVV